jgi:hypothetical protein
MWLTTGAIGVLLLIRQWTYGLSGIPWLAEQHVPVQKRTLHHKSRFEDLQHNLEYTEFLNTFFLFFTFVIILYAQLLLLQVLLTELIMSRDN